MTVLPTFAPSTTGIACASVMIPALTKPISMIVVAAELWMIPVTPVPNAQPLTAPSALFFEVVIVARICSNPDPASCSSEEPIRLMPKRNSPTPPNSSKMEMKSIKNTPHHVIKQMGV